MASQLARQAQKDGSSSTSNTGSKSRGSGSRSGEQDLDNLKLVDSFVDRVIKSKQRGSSQSEQSSSRANGATGSSSRLTNRATGSTASGLGVDHAGSTGFAHAGGSTSFSQPDGNTSISHAGGSTSFSHAGGSTSFSHPDSNTDGNGSISHAGGSTSFSHPDGTSISRAGGSTSFSHAGGSTSFSHAAAGSTAFGTQSRGTGSTLGKESCGVQSSGSRNRSASGVSNGGDGAASASRNGAGLCNAGTGSRVNGSSSSSQRVGSQQQGPHKIIIKTIRNLPPKVTTSTRAKPRSECAALHNSSSRVCGGSASASASGSSHKIVKKTITYSYIDDYHPTTKVYEVLEPTAAEQASQNASTSVKDLFAPKSAQHNYLFKPFDPAIAESIGKPSTEQLNKFLSIHNTGLKSSGLVQIHPLINSKTDVRSKLSNGSQGMKDSTIHSYIIL